MEESLEKDFNTYMGKKFERFIRTEILRNICPFRVTKIGKWWGFYREDGKRKELEIDAICLNENTKEILFLECKWKDLQEKQSKEVLKKLQDKSRYVQWNNDHRKEYFGLAAKKIHGKDELRKQGFLIFDPDDI